MIKRFRKKPVVIEAVQWTGENLSAIAEFTGQAVTGATQTPDGAAIGISTLEGEMQAKPGDYIIKGVKGEFYPCKPDIFEATYEEVVVLVGGDGVEHVHPVVEKPEIERQQVPEFLRQGDGSGYDPDEKPIYARVPRPAYDFPIDASSPLDGDKQ